MNDYDKKIKLCKLLGAKQFQKVVLNIERIKFKIIKLLFPNIIKWHTNLCNRNCEKYIKAHPELDSNQIRHTFMLRKIIFNGEINKKKNSNYHFNTSNPLEFIKWLNFNKHIHEKGLIIDAILLGVLTGISVISPSNIPIELGLIITTLSSLINFECVNLQNYNIYRFKKSEKLLQEAAQKKELIDNKKYGQVSNKITSLLDQKKDILEPQELVDNIDDKKELEELRDLLIRIRNKDNQTYTRRRTL